MGVGDTTEVCGDVCGDFVVQYERSLVFSLSERL